MPQSEMKILVIEDNPGDYILVKEYLQEEYSNAAIYHAIDIISSFQFIADDKFDIILLDLSLPDGNGINTFLAIQEKSLNTPIIILTGLKETNIALESVKFGAQDFIVKDNCNSITLFKSINYAIERSKINDRLKKSEEQYKYLFNNNPLPMWAFDKNTFQFLMVNGAAINHYGYSEKEFLSMKMTDISVYDETNNMLSFTPYENILEKTTKDYRHKQKSGTIIEVEIVTHDLLIEGSEAGLAVIHDVTEKNKARDQLYRSEQMFRKISDSFPNGTITILDKGFTFLFMAGSELQKQGLQASTFMNTNFTSHFQSPLREFISEMLALVFKGEEKVFEVNYGSLIYMVSAVPLHESDGRIEKILLASQNISEQKKNEIEKELLIEELTQNNSDLRQFSYITSHNLRAPLSNLTGIIKLINTETITDPVNAMLLKNFEECTLQLNETVNDLLNVLIIKNNVNAGKEVLNIRKVFEKVAHSIQSTINKFEMDVELDIDEAPDVVFNHTYLESILLNLLTNAIKYRSPKRKPKLVLKTEKNSSGVKLYFSDNGLGIDLDRYGDRIFGLYQRFHDHPDSKGLGLYIVNSQIRVMGGEIDIESEVDKGTTFILTFKN